MNQADGDAADINEYNGGHYVVQKAHGREDITAIPVFLHRRFRHGFISVNRKTVRTPKDLAGKRIGVPEWAQTAGIYTRGLLAQQSGLGLGDVEWVQAGIHETGRQEEVAVNPPAGVTVVRYSDRTLNDMLLSGEIDAMISAHAPPSFEAGDRRIRRLFGDFMDIERRYWH